MVGRIVEINRNVKGNTFIKYNATTYNGVSGGPIFIKNKNMEWILIGVHNGMYQNGVRFGILLLNQNGNSIQTLI